MAENCLYCNKELKGQQSKGRHLSSDTPCGKRLEEDMTQLYNAGKPPIEIAKRLRVHPDTVYRRLEILGVRTPGTIRRAPAPEPVNEKSLGAQVLEEAFAYKDRAILAEGELAKCQEELSRLTIEIANLKGYKEMYEQAIQDRAKAFIEHSEPGRL